MHALCILLRCTLVWHGVLSFTLLPSLSKLGVTVLSLPILHLLGSQRTWRLPILHPLLCTRVVFQMLAASLLFSLRARVLSFFLPACRLVKPYCRLLLSLSIPTHAVQLVLNPMMFLLAMVTGLMARRVLQLYRTPELSVKVP